MKNFPQLLLSLILISGSAFAAEQEGQPAAAEPQAHEETKTDAHGNDLMKNRHQGESEQEHGKRQGEFYPRKKADKNLATRLPQVELLEPKAYSEISGGQVTLKWKAVETADSYRLQVATDPNFKWIVTQQDLFKGTSFDLKGLEAGKHYFWRVYALRPQNDANWSASFANLSEFETK